VVCSNVAGARPPAPHPEEAAKRPSRRTRNASAGPPKAGLRKGEIRVGVDAQQTATAFIACIEGGVMLSHLYGDPAYLRAARRHLEDHVARALRPPPLTRSSR